MSSLSIAPVAPRAAAPTSRGWPPIPVVIGAIVLLPPVLALALTALLVEAKTAVAESLVRRAWARTCTSGRPAAPWDGASARPVARVLLPEAGLDAVVLSDAAPEVDHLGPVWLGNRDGGGEPRGVVIAGDRPGWLRHLQQALPGHLLTLDWLDPDDRRVRTRSYRIEGLVRSASGARVGPGHPGEDALLLVGLPRATGDRGAGPLVVRAAPVAAQ